MRFFLPACLALLLLASVFVFSWLPEPSLGKLPWLPHWIGRWADRFENFRTAIPFLGLGLLAGVWIRNRKGPSRQYLHVFAALSLLVLVAELGQLFLPHRHCDWQDILWGMAGSAAGLLPAALFRRRAKC